MKSVLAVTALMASVTMHGQGMVGSSRREYGDKPVKKIIPAPFQALVLSPPKGHKIESISLQYPCHNRMWHIEVEYSYGTSKSNLKRRTAKIREVQEYIRNVPVEILLERNEFYSEESPI